MAAVHQPDGKTGSVVGDVEVPDFSKEPLTLSGVVFASEGTATDRALLSDARLRAILGGNPTTRRRFARHDALTAFAEVYNDGGTAREEVWVTATVTSDGGVVAWREAARRVTNAPDRAGYITRVPLVAWNPATTC